MTKKQKTLLISAILTVLTSVIYTFTGWDVEVEVSPPPTQVVSTASPSATPSVDGGNASE